MAFPYWNLHHGHYINNFFMVCKSPDGTMCPDRAAGMTNASGRQRHPRLFQYDVNHEGNA